jgi:predicted nucleic acid-binding protein
MLVLIDTGILLRVVNRHDPRHAEVRQALRNLRRRGDSAVFSTQGASEFWNVSTRPASARGGYGLSVSAADRRLRVVEQLFPLLPDTPDAYARWRRLIVAYGVQGVQVHDAKLVALMLAHGVSHLLTLNTADFVRYSGLITVWVPADVPVPTTP